MPIEVTCPSCSATLPAPNEFAGKKIRCADCQGIVEVPAAKVDPAPAFAKPVSRIRPQPEDVADDRAVKRRLAADDEATSTRRKPKKEWDEDDDTDSRKRRGSKPGVLTGFSMVWLIVVGVLGIAGLTAVVWAVMPVAGNKAVAADAPKAVAAVPPAAVVKPDAAAAMNNFGPLNEQPPKVEFVPDPEAESVAPPRPRPRPSSTRAFPPNNVPRFDPNLAPPQAIVPTPNQKGLVAKYADRLKTRASSTYGSYPVTRLFDGIETSIWFSDSGDTVGSGNSPWVEVTFPEDVTIHAMTMLGNRDTQWPGYQVHAGRFDFIDKAGKTLSSHDVTAVGDKFDMKSDLEADVTGVRTVRFTVTKDLSKNWIALSEWTLE